MRFVRKLHPSNGQFSVYLDMEGLTLPIPKLEGSTSTIEEDNNNLDTFCYFKISTFDILRPKKEDGDDFFDDVFRPIHVFFDRCNHEEKIALATMYLNMHFDILDKLRVTEDVQTNISDVTSKLSLYLADVDKRIDIVGKLRAIVDETIPVPMFNNIGDRPQDSEEMTFHRESVLELATVVLLSKLMTPIFGVFIERCKKKMDTSLKELHTVGILKDIFENRFRNIVLKLKNFLFNLIKPHVKDEIKYVYHGYTLFLVVEQIFAAIVVRRFVNVNLHQPNCNIMTYITACARSAITSTTSTASSHKSSVGEIKKPEELHGDDGNTSILEVESRRSVRTADQLGLVDLATECAIRSFLQEYEVPRKDYEEAVNYYLENPSPLTPIGVYLLCTYFGKALGGAGSIASMSVKSSTKLIAVMQIILIKLGYPELVHILTVRKALFNKIIPTQVDNMIRATWNNTYEYRNVSQRFPYSIVDLRWDTKLKEIVEYITVNNHYRNTAPIICAMMGETDAGNEQIYMYNDTIVIQLCSFLSTITVVGMIE